MHGYSLEVYVETVYLKTAGILRQLFDLLVRTYMQFFYRVCYEKI